jgi:ribosome-binding protein aMBF1 (putative translation factor)
MQTNTKQKTNTISSLQSKNMKTVVANIIEDEKDDCPKIKTTTESQKMKIINARIKLGFNQKKMAELIGINHNLLKDYESGKVVFQPHEWTKINNSIDKLLKTNI